MHKSLIGSQPPRILLALGAILWLLATSIVSSGATATAFAATPVTVGGKAVVTNTGGDPIRVRQDAGTEFAQLGVAHEGDVVSVLAGPRNDKKSSPWFKVQATGVTGWMSAEFLQGTSSPPTAPRLTGYARVANTNGDPLRLREAPSQSAKVLVLLDPGTTVLVKAGPVTDETGIAWYEIAAKGFTGWAMSQYLVQAQATPATPAAPAAPATPAAPAPTQTPTRKEAPQIKPIVASKPPTATATPTATQKPVEKPKAQPTAETRGGATSTTAQYRQWMEEARQMYPYKQSVDKMWSVMMCESGGNPRASGGGGRYLGLFQYAPSTWGGSWNPYRNNSIWDAKSQIFATAKAWSIGMQSAWSCYYITAGR